MNSLIEENPNRKTDHESTTPPNPPTLPVETLETLFYLKEGMVIEKKDLDLYIFAATTGNDNGLISVFRVGEYFSANRLSNLGLIEMVSQHHNGDDYSKHYSMYRATLAGKLLYRMFENLIW